MNKRAPRLIYHYCSLPTFKSIVESKSIWLSDISKSNDSKELQWFLEECDAYLIEKHMTIMSRYTEILKKKLEEFDNMSTHNSISSDEEALYNIKHKEFTSGHEYFKQYLDASIVEAYSFCMSEKKDDLSQWRGYGDDGYGISIGFRTDYFKKIIDSMRILNSLSLRKVIYGRNNVRSFLDNKFDFKNLDNLSFDIDVEEFIKDITIAVLTQCAVFKNPAFKSESEWRLISSSFNAVERIKEGSFVEITTPNDTSISDIAEINKMDYSIKKRELVSHVVMKFKSLNDAIGEIIVGPKSTITIPELKKFLKYNDLIASFIKDRCKDKIYICKSELSYSK